MFRIIVEADYALFTRPEAKVERVSYPVPTPSALEGMLKSVFWKPAIRYKIDKIVVFNPIQYISVRRNEVSCKVSESKVKSQMRGKGQDPTVYTSEAISQRMSVLLKNVKYGVEFHFELTGIASEEDKKLSNPSAKYAETIRRRLESGQYFRAPCMGAREFGVKSMRLVEDFPYEQVDKTLKNTQDLGYMLYGINFHDDERLSEAWDKKYFSDSMDAVYYHPYLVDGVVDVKKYREEQL